MKTPRLLATLCLLGSLAHSTAQLNIPAADGSDGAFNPSGATYEVDLSQAIAGDAITSSNSGGNSGRGIYDSSRWVVVYKYSSVNVPAGTTVTFKNHPSYAPVVWLVQNSVVIAGTVNLNGRNGVSGTDSVFPNEPGPGGFRGGAGSTALGGGSGLGPGAGGPGTNATYLITYGNTQIFPLIGGSGGGAFSLSASGGSGGGAIMIAATGTIQFGSPGAITAIGGNGFNGSGGPSGYGSGGAVKLVANQVTGTGTLNAGAYSASSHGRVRVEANSMPATITTTPLTIAVAPGVTPTLFQSSTSPSARVVSVDAVPAPADPNAPLITGADIGIQKSVAVTIVVETRNFSTSGGVVNVRLAGKYSGVTSLNINAPDAGGTTALSTWRVNTVVPAGFSTVQARATGP